MPKFSFEHKCSHSPQNTYDKIKNFLVEDDGLKKLDPKIKYEFQDAKMLTAAVGSQFKAQMQVVETSNGAKVEITVDLPLLLTPFKTKIQESLERKLNRVLA